MNIKTEILATKVFVKDECLALKEDIHALRNETHALRSEMKDNTISLQKWMLSIFITLVVMIMGLYATILLKH